MAQDKIIKRKDVAVENTWNLCDLFENDDKWFEELEACGAYLAKIAEYRGKLATSAKTFYEWLLLSDEISLRVEALANYAMRKCDEDQTNGFYLDMRGKLMNFYVAISGASSFYMPEMIAIDDEVLEGFFKEIPELELYRHAIEKERKMKPHILSDAEERILAACGQIAEASEDVFSALLNADIRFPEVEDSEGNKHVLTQGTYIEILHSSDRKLRENTFEAFYKTFESYKNTIAATFDGQMKKLKFYADMRKFDSTLEASLNRTEVPVEVYHNLIETVHNNMDKMYKYIELRKKLMGVDELHMYDIYCPIVNEMNKEITFEDAKANVLEGLGVLGEDYVALLKEGFDNRWIDVYENEGKRGGAYSAGARPHPYVLLNHKNNIDSQFTLAHEMGHALHSYYSNHNQPVVYSDYVIFVAEVASTCNEVLLMKSLLAKTTDPKEKAYLINYFLEQFRTTLYRQTMFAEFELDINKISESGSALTADILNQRYYEINKLYYGDGMVVDERIQSEWSRIPHFFYNYYVFQYATGFAAAVAIAEKILNEGKPAVDAYKAFLSGGCSQDPISLLKIAGVDMTTPEPINNALKLFGSLIDEMDALLA
ncbi:MAG: oligoendopeptidase F [Clostridiales bacterium]|nr:oligoendopeptidase F [Clostridiales bacterium]